MEIQRHKVSLDIEYRLRQRFVTGKIVGTGKPDLS